MHSAFLRAVFGLLLVFAWAEASFVRAELTSTDAQAISALHVVLPVWIRAVEGRDVRVVERLCVHWRGTPRQRKKNRHAEGDTGDSVFHVDEAGVVGRPSVEDGGFAVRCESCKLTTRCPYTATDTRIVGSQT